MILMGIGLVMGNGPRIEKESGVWLIYRLE